MATILITSGGTYTANPGDIFIIGPSVGSDVQFVAPNGTVAPLDFEIRVNSSNTSGKDFAIKFSDSKGPLSPEINIASNVNISKVTLDLKDTADSAVNVGDNVSIKDIAGGNGNEGIVLGDNVDLGDGSIDLGGSTTTEMNSLLAGDGLTVKDITGSKGADTITLGDGATVEKIDTGGGNDVLTIGDDLTGPSGSKSLDISTGDGNDAITIGDNAKVDKIDTGKGNDSIVLGDNTEIKDLDMGSGADVANIGTLVRPGGSGSNNITLDGGGGSAIDCLTLDISWLSASERAAFFQALYDGDYVFDANAGGYIPGDANGDGKIDPENTITIDLDGGGELKLKDWEKINVVCFARGTRIETIDGPANIETLEKGDLIRTLDHGYQQIRWVGSVKVPALGKLAPVLIRKGAIGNHRDLLVSPQHRVLLSGWQLELLFSEHEALVPAIHLVNDQSILQKSGGEVEYFHIMFDRHEIIFSEGVPSESYHPGELGLGSMNEASRDEILGLFPQLRASLQAYGPSARSTLKRHEVVALADQFAQTADT